MARPRHLLPLVLVLSLCCLAGSRKPKMLVSFHIEADREEAAMDTQGKFVIPLTLGNPPTTYYFHKIPELTNKQIEGFYAFPSRTGEGYGTAFKLNNQGRDRLQTVTTQNSGKRLLTTVSTRPVNFVVIDRAISHGYIVVWSGLTEADLAVFRESMTEIVPKTGVVGAAAPGSAGQREDSATEEGPRKRGLFGRLFRGREKKAEAPEDEGGGSADDFAFPPYPGAAPAAE